MNGFAVVLLGPTCTGKTEIALELAENIGEIISVDSMQVYKYMDIGTAKPLPAELNRVKHHLIDIIYPDNQFTAGEFKRESQKLIPEIIKRDKIPFLVGGTGLYFLSLIRGMVDIPKINPIIKEYLIEKHNKVGQERLYNILKRLDPIYANKIHQNDKQRTLRALEVIIGTKRKFSSFLEQQNIKDNFTYIIVGLTIDRNELYERIDRRVDKMIENGLVDEVKFLLSKGYRANSPGLKAIGYKEIIAYFNDVISLDEAINQIKKNTRNYAKRQFTWFKKMDNVVWFDYKEKEIIKSYIKQEIIKLKYEKMWTNY